MHNKSAIIPLNVSLFFFFNSFFFLVNSRERYVPLFLFLQVKIVKRFFIENNTYIASEQTVCYAISVVPKPFSSYMRISVIVDNFYSNSVKIHYKYDPCWIRSIRIFVKVLVVHVEFYLDTENKVFARGATSPMMESLNR